MSYNNGKNWHKSKEKKEVLKKMECGNMMDRDYGSLKRMEVHGWETQKCI